MDGTVIHNPTAMDVWISVNDRAVEVKAGSLMDLA